MSIKDQQSAPELRRRRLAERRKKVDALTKLIKQAEELQHAVGHAQFYIGAMSKDRRWETEAALQQVIKGLRAERLSIPNTISTNSNEGQ